jgi:23S rRNA (guanosine2251-2'-O)-methyltransferase
MSNDIYIYGRNAVSEALENQPERIDKIFVRNSIADHYISDIINNSSSQRIPVSHVPGKKLLELVGRVNDQGVAALMSTIEYQHFEKWLEGINTADYPAILLLDEIEDPHNVGAVLRSAAAAGLAAVITPKHRQAPINAVVYKTSAGAAGKIPVIRAGNLNQAILKLKEAGFWIVGLDVKAKQSIWELEVDRPLAFVIGNEGRGIRQKTLEHCDYTFAIPMANNVESLNTSVSTALVCYEWKRKKKM